MPQTSLSLNVGRERPTTTIGAHNIPLEEHSDSDVQVAGAIGYDESIKPEGELVILES